MISELKLHYYGDGEDWLALSQVLGLSTSTLSVEGLRTYVDLYLTNPGHPSGDVERGILDRLAGMRMCPISHGIITDLGLSVPRMMVIEHLHCSIRVLFPGMTEYASISLEDDCARADAPLGGTVSWSSRDRGSYQRHIDIADDMPQSVVTGLVGRPLREIIRHGDLDPYEMRVEKVMRLPTNAGDRWRLAIGGHPPSVPYRNLSIPN